MSREQGTHDYLTELLNRYWFAPPVALWRAVELRTVAQEPFEPPLLDLGCGDGMVGEVFFGAGGVGAGVDPWLAQLRRAARSGVYRTLALADGARLPYADGAFATVFSNSVLEHIPLLEPVLGEVARVLRPLGRFVFTVPSDGFPRLLAGWRRHQAAGREAQARTYREEMDAWLQHHHYHTPDEWRRLLARSGLALTEARYYIPAPVEELWEAANRRYGLTGGLSPWRLVAAERLRGLGYAALVRRTVVRTLGRRWRGAYQAEVAAGEVGGGLLVVAEKA